MNRFKLQTFIVLISAFAFATPSIVYAKTVNLRPDPVISETQTQCVTTGCSGEICVDASTGPLNSTCQWKEEYSCLPKAKCEVQNNGKCGWTYTREYNQCVADKQPVTTPTPSNTCEDSICEEETNITDNKCLGKKQDSCSYSSSQIVSDSCTTDCKTPTTTPMATATPIPTVTIVPTKISDVAMPTLSKTPEQPQVKDSLNTYRGFTKLFLQTPLTIRSERVINKTTPSLYDRIIKHIRSLLPHYFG